MSDISVNASFQKCIETVKNNILSNINCHNIGRIVDYNKDNGTCSIELMHLRQWNGDYFYNALIPNVPLISFGTKNARIMPPNPIGSYCVLLFLDRNMDSFMETGEAQKPYTTRKHSMTDCVALLTINSFVDDIPEYNDNAFVISNKETKENIEYKSNIKIFPDNIDINTSTGGNIKIDDKVKMTSIFSGGNIEISNKIKIENNNNNLNVLIQNLLTACENISTINGGDLTPTTKQAFTDLKTQFGELLQ